MNRIFLTSVAALALTAGGAWAQDATATDGDALDVEIVDADELSIGEDIETLDGDGTDTAMDGTTTPLILDGEDDDAMASGGMDATVEDGAIVGDGTDTAMDGTTTPLILEEDAIEGETATIDSDMSPDADTEMAVEATGLAGDDAAMDGTMETVEIEDADTTAESVTEMAEMDPLAPAGGLYGSFAELRVDDLVGMEVIGSMGDDMGEIDHLVSDGSQLLAVIGTGGFLGLFERDVAIPLDRFEIGEDGLRLPSLSEDEVESMPEWTGEFDGLDRDVVIGDAL
jgi:hypothetical protein